MTLSEDPHRPADGSRHISNTGVRRDQYGRTRTNGMMGWTLSIIAAAVALGLLVYNFASKNDAPNPPNPPAVTSAPAPATGVPAPRPEQTTGQTAPPAR